MRQHSPSSPGGGHMHQRPVAATARKKLVKDSPGITSSTNKGLSPKIRNAHNSKRHLVSPGVLYLALFVILLLGPASVFLFYYSNSASFANVILTKVLDPKEQIPMILRNNNNDGGGKPIKIAHAISLITCHKQSRVKGFLDALMILRHTIHQNSVHRFEDEDMSLSQRTTRPSKYSYQMYAILHKDGGCLEHVPLLKRLGYTALVVETPVNVSDLPEGWYKGHVENENCCGSKEFIKLYAYTLLDHPIVVHWDLDVAVLQPMDDLYDAMLYPADSNEGKAARQRLRIQKPYHQKLPDQIDAFFTRDITSSVPWETISPVQGGFVVARPSLEHLEMYKKFIMEANFTKGRGPGSGWGGLGYGGFQGAMAYQGVLAYFYDVVYPGHHVELDVCYWNQVVADVIWRGPKRRDEFYGQCREYPAPGVDHKQNTPENGKCHDCRILPIQDTRTVHYTACKKPWECIIPHPRVPRNPAETERLRHLTNITTCGLLFREYFLYRKDIEKRLGKALRSPVPIEAETKGDEYYSKYFLGYCGRSGGYLSMNIPDDFDMRQIYGF